MDSSRLHAEPWAKSHRAKSVFPLSLKEKQRALQKEMGELCPHHRPEKIRQRSVLK